MQLDAANNEIKYEDTVGTIARYVLILDGEPTMHILCDSADPERVIRIATATSDSETATSDTLDLLSTATLGRFKLTTKLTEDADGMPLGAATQVDAQSVYTYVIPRMHVLLGRLLRGA